MDIQSFQKYLEIAKDLGVSKFRIEENKLFAEFGPEPELPAKQVDLKEILGDMPSDRELLNLDELPDERSPRE